MFLRARHSNDMEKITFLFTVIIVFIYVYVYVYFGIQSWAGMDGLVGWIWPTGHQLMITALLDILTNLQLCKMCVG